MGTNFYLRKVKPRMVYDEYHIAKRSYGWRIYFQDSEEYKYEDNPPIYHSVEDIRKLLESGEYQLVNEYGDTWEPGVESIKEFNELCKWNVGNEYDGMSYSTYSHDELSCDYGGYNEYLDPQGYPFTSYDFR